MRAIDSKVLQSFSGALLISSGLGDKQASLVAHHLVQTSLWGIDSHGVARLPHYLNRIEKGSINPRPEMKYQKGAASVGNLDGDHGLGIVVCTEAMSRAIDLAKTNGVGIVGVRNSSHCGAIGLYTRQACLEGFIGVAFTHSDSFVVPHGGKKAFFGTNPISIAVPSETIDKPLCVDMATSIVPWNRIMNARRDAITVPDDWGVDSRGERTTDPEKVVAVLPTAEHKGYALAFLIDMLCGPLNGMPFGVHIPKMYENLEQKRMLGSLMIAMNPRCFFGGDTLNQSVQQAINEVKNQGAVMFPGEPEYSTAAKRSDKGIPVESALAEEFVTWAAKLGVCVPANLQ